jgi:hypothetical protein
MDFKNLGGQLTNAGTYETDLSNFKVSDISPLTLLNTEESMTKIAEKIGTLSETLAEINTELKTKGKAMQDIADGVNSGGYFTW